MVDLDRMGQDICEAWQCGKIPYCSPYSPRPSARNLDDMHLPADGSRMRLLFQRHLRRLAPQLQEELTLWARQLPRPFRIGTFCSGTDVALLCWAGFQEALEIELGVTISVETSYCCESDRRKQTFLRALHPSSKVLFGDTSLLRQDRAINLIDGCEREVPASHHEVGGFPCDDASALNPDGNRRDSEHRSCVAAGSLRTGNVLHDVVRHLIRHGGMLKFLILENVRGLGRPCVDKNGDSKPDNATVVREFLSRVLDMHVFIYKLDPRLWGAPQVRGRLYFVGIQRQLLQGYAAGDVDALFASVMDTIAGCRMTPLEHFLLREDSPAVQAMFRTLLAQKCKDTPIDVGAKDHMARWLAGDGFADTARSSTRRLVRHTPNWVNKHKALFAKAGMDWASVDATPPHEVIEAFPGLLGILPREFELMLLEGIEYFPEAHGARSIEVGQLVGREHVQDNLVSTVVPRMRKYITTRCRLVTGREALNLQSIFFPAEVAGRLDTFSNELLMDLAGNAFDANCYAATFFCSIVVLAHTSACSARVPEAKPEDSEDELEQVWCM